MMDDRSSDFEDSVQIDITEGGKIIEMDKSTTDKKEKEMHSLSKNEVTTKECPVKNVTVFTDRAEVNRVIDLDLKTGNAEVLLKDLPSCVDPDSVRYELLGAGNKRFSTLSRFADFFRYSTGEGVQQNPLKNEIT